MSRLGRKESGRRLHGVPKKSGHIEGIITHLAERTCRLETGSNSYPLVTLTIGMLDVEFEVESPPEMRVRLDAFAGRFTRAAAIK
jgi:hypothetical protein